MDSDLDPFDDVLLEPALKNARAGGKFQPKAKPKPRNISTASVPVVPQSEAKENSDAPLPNSIIESGSLQPVAAVSLEAACNSLAFVSNDSNGLQENLATQNSGSSSALMESDVASQHPVTCSIHTDDGMLESELQESRAFSNLQLTDIFSDSIAGSDSRTRKFQPELKSRDGAESVVTPTDAQFVHSETMCINESSIPAFQSDDVLDYSSISFGDFTTSELPTNEEQADIAQSCCPQDAHVVHLEDAHEEPEDENRGRKASYASNQIDEGDASSRQLRKRAVVFQLIDEPEDEVGGLSPEPPSSSMLDEEDKDYDHREDEDDNDNDNDNSGQQHSSQDRMSKRKKKHVPEKEKPVRKRKGSDDALDLPSQKPPRKFSHSTRRKKRLQELLALPEHEIEFQRLPCADIILLAGYREQLANKEAKASKASQNNQSTEKSFDDVHLNNEEDTHGNSRMESTFTLFNSHSFMDKTPRIRWSKQDTELFYEGVRQFGTDLSMIQQLFPGRTRHQIKLKLKKEERQQRTRLYEALSNRPKDHSYFEKVIEQLQKAAAQAEEEFVRDESVSGTGKEEADLYSENNDDAGKSENDNDAAVEDEGVNTVQVHSPVKSDENDDDLDIWSSYRSDF